ncbi:MAG: hypothetical protein AAGI08_00225 [Bacteroidota bacterium]
MFRTIRITKALLGDGTEITHPAGTVLTPAQAEAVPERLRRTLADASLPWPPPLRPETGRPDAPAPEAPAKTRKRKPALPSKDGDGAPTPTDES